MYIAITYYLYAPKIIKVRLFNKKRALFICFGPGSGLLKHVSEKARSEECPYLGLSTIVSKPPAREAEEHRPRRHLPRKRAGLARWLPHAAAREGRVGKGGCGG